MLPGCDGRLQTVWSTSENLVGKQAKQRKFIHLPKINLTLKRQFCCPPIMAQETKHLFHVIVIKMTTKTGFNFFPFKMFTRSVSRIKMIFNDMIFRNGVNCTHMYQHYSEISIIIFPISHTPEELFFLHRTP